jgi:hypothetical protein
MFTGQRAESVSAGLGTLVRLSSDFSPASPENRLAPGFTERPGSREPLVSIIHAPEFDHESFV